MSPIVRLICKILVVSLLSTGSVTAIASLQQPGMTYEQFMHLSVGNRRDRFAAMTAEQKANLKQTHAQRWLDGHRASLNQRQIDLMIEAISFLSPDRYRNPPQNDDRKREAELQRKLTCELGRARVTTAFTFLDPPRKSLSNSVDEWLAWFPDCVLRG